MRRFGFMDREVDPAEVYSRTKEIIQKLGFTITSEEVQDGYWDLHARKSGIKRIATGTVRDLNFILSGDRKKFSVELHAGIFGRDYVVPAIEGAATLGLAAAAELRAAGKFEENLWEDIVRMIGPSLLVCNRDGRIFETQTEFEEHLEKHRKDDQMENETKSWLQTGQMGWI